MFSPSPRLGELAPIKGPLRDALLSCAPELTRGIQHGAILGCEGCAALKAGQHAVVKYGRKVKLAEAEAMKFAARSATIPAPAAFGACRGLRSGEKIAFIILERAEGENLKEIWSGLETPVKKKLSTEIKVHIKQLRALSEAYIGMAGFQPCNDQVFQASSQGPFEAEKNMNDEIMKGFEGAFPGFLGPMIRKMLRSDHKILFCHGDLKMQSILAKGDKIAGILDWEMAGHYPERWECVKATWRADWESDWGVYLQDMLKPHYDEHATAQLLK